MHDMWEVDTISAVLSHFGNGGEYLYSIGGGDSIHTAITGYHIIAQSGSSTCIIQVPGQMFSRSYFRLTRKIIPALYENNWPVPCTRVWNN